MKRIEIRALKRAVARNDDAEAMVRLLARSVRFGHEKLALIRCIQAESLGIQIPPALLAYCERVADGLSEEVLQRLLEQVLAKSLASARCLSKA